MSTAVQAKPFNIVTHNGLITVRSTKGTGEHRTIRIHTQSKDAKFAPGQRVAQLLVGPDNESDYRAFGFVTIDGRICLFKKHREERFYQWMKAFMENPERFPSVEFNFEGHCRRCGRLLSDPLSCEIGLGPTCRELEGA